MELAEPAIEILAKLFHRGMSFQQGQIRFTTGLLGSGGTGSAVAELTYVSLPSAERWAPPNKRARSQAAIGLVHNPAALGREQIYYSRNCSCSVTPPRTTSSVA